MSADILSEKETYSLIARLLAAIEDPSNPPTDDERSGLIDSASSWMEVKNAEMEQTASSWLGDGTSLRTTHILHIHEEEEGLLYGALFIAGVGACAVFVRVKWRADDGTTNEDYNGEQVPWNEEEDSTAYSWWDDLVHTGIEGVFETVQVPGFPGHYVVFITPGTA